MTREIDRDAMRATLGAMLIDEGMMLEALALLRRDAMYGPERHILDALRAIANRGDKPGVMIVRDELERTKKLEVAGDVANISLMLDCRAISENLEILCKMVNREARLRVARGICQKAIEACNAGEDDAVERLERAVLSIQDEDIDDHKPESLASILPRILEGRPPGLKIGYWMIDWATSGLGAGWLVTLAARPSVGKTTIATCIAKKVAEDGFPVVFFSLEVPSDEIGSKLLARSGANTELIKIGDSTSMRAAERASDLSIEIIAPGKSTIIQIRAAIRRAKPKPKLVIIDYLQFIEPDNRREKRYEQVDRITKELKWTAREFGIPIIALAQLSRAVEAGGKLRRPYLSDIRESGGIEQNSDLVIFLHRERAEDKAGVAELILEKNRHGPDRRSCELWFRGETASFDDFER